jgi:hypothetical protein
MDNNSRGISTIEKLIELAKSKNRSLILVGPPDRKPAQKFQVPYQKLKSILQKTKDLNMKFYTVAEVCNKSY